MADGGCTHAVMEVSSHALALERTYGIRFAVGLFTNLTQDHLDFHGTMENYCAAKSKLMRSCDVAVYNADDPWSRQILRGSTCRRFAYGVERKCQLQAKEITYYPDRVAYTACTDWEELPVHCAIPGAFSVYNSLAAMAACRTLGVPLQRGAQVLGRERGAPGRMEVVPTGRDFTLLIDYAVTPDALDNMIRTVRDTAGGRVGVLFGCGGDRDRTKRPKMGRVVASLADYVIITSDNPRTEDPEAIIADILPGLEGLDTPCVVIPDRREAIFHGIANARSGDTLVLTGKGHETYQIIGKEKHHMDEREIVADALKALEEASGS